MRVRGFTLIEILIVMVIISIVASFAVLSIHFNSKKHVESFTRHVENILSLAQQEAILGSRTLGFKLSENHFQFYEFDDEAGEKSSWRAVQDKNLGLHKIPDGITMKMKLPNTEKNTEEEEKDKPQIVISPSGEVSSFSLIFGNKKGEKFYKIVGLENGTLSSEKVNAE